MSAEYRKQTPEEIWQGLLQAGRSDEELMSYLSLINQGVEEGEIRTRISCWDHLVGFFKMAERAYVKNVKTEVLADAELGIHLRDCLSPICQRLGRFYFEELRPSSDIDSAKIAGQLRELLTEITLGERRPDLEGKKSMFYDSQTGKSLFEVKVVEITDKCTLDEQADEKTKEITGVSREILLAYVPYSGGMFCDIKDSYSYRQAFNIGERFSPNNESLINRAADIGMDPMLLYAIVRANAPKASKNLLEAGKSRFPTEL